MNELLLWLLTLELVSFFGWAVLRRSNAATHEITVRHLLLNMMGTAFLIMGLAIVYACQYNVGPKILPLAAIFIFAGLGIRIGLFPFAMHLPNTVRPTANKAAALLLIPPFIIGLAFLIRLTAILAPDLAGRFWPVPAFIAAISIILSGAAAMVERNLRSLLAYILIGQAGFILIGLAAALSTQAGNGQLSVETPLAAALFYLIKAAPAILGAFGVLVYLGRRHGDINDIEELSGLDRSHPWAARAMALFLLSLSGIPPLAGFWGRAAVLSAAVSACQSTPQTPSWWFAALLIVAVTNAVMTTIVCARLMAVMFFKIPLATPIVWGGRATAAFIFACAILAIALGPVCGPLLEASCGFIINSLY